MDTPVSAFNKLEQLTRDYQQLIQLIKQHNYQPSAEQTQLLKRTKTLLIPYLDAKKKGLLPTTTTPPPKEEEVEINDFVSACTQWRIDMDIFLEKSTQDYQYVNIKTASFKNHLIKYKSPLPIVQDLYTEWVTVLEQLSTQGDTTTGALLFTALKEQQGTAWLLTNDLEGLKKHYRKNRREYKRTSGGSDSFIKGHLPKTKALLDALAISSSERDPNLPENKEQAELEAKEDAKDALKTMKRQWSDWLTQTTVPNLEATDTSTEGKLIDLALLQQNRTVYLTSPSYAQTFWTATSETIVAQAKALGGTPSYDQVALIAVKVTKEQYNIHVMNEHFIQTAIESKEGDLPSGLKRWLVNSIEQDNQLYNQLVSICTEWVPTVQDLAGTAEQSHRNKTFKVDRKKWAKALDHLFTGPTRPLAAPLQAALPQDPILPLAAIQQAWKQGLTDLQHPDFLQQLWTEQFTRNPDQAAIESVLTAFKTNLPQLNRLAQQLIDAQYHAQTSKPLMEYAQTDTVQTRLAVNWNDVRILVGSGLQKVSEETGLESIAETLAGITTGNWNIDTTGGLENIGLRATAPMNLDLKLPLKLQQQGSTVLAIPTPLETSMVKFVGGDDGHYAITIQRTTTNNQPQTQGNSTTQEVLVTLAIEDPQLSIALSGSAGIASVEASVNKNPTKTTVDLVFTLTQTYQMETNQLQVQFTAVRLVEATPLIQGVNLVERPTQTLQVYR